MYPDIAFDLLKAGLDGCKFDRERQDITYLTCMLADGARL
jgi:hypothetical protein